MSTWTPPPGMTVEHLHGDEEQPVHVAIVTLAPGAAMAETEVHADLTEQIHLLSGGLCVVKTLPRPGAPSETDDVPYDLSALSGHRRIEIAAGVPHRIVNWNRLESAVYVATMIRPREEQPKGLLRAAADHARAIDDGEELGAPGSAIEQAMGWLDDARTSVRCGDPQEAIVELDGAMARIFHARSQLAGMVTL